MDYSVDMPDGTFRYGGSGEDAFEKDTLATVLRESVVGMAVVSPHPDGVKLLYTNDAFFNMFGYTREEYETIDIDTRFNLFVMDDFVDIVKRINTPCEPGSTQRFECRMNQKNGETGWLLITTRKPMNVDFNEQIFVINLVDITDLKHLQMQIQKEKERYEIVEEITDDILFTYDVIEDVFEASPKILRNLRKRTRLENAIENITYGDVFDHRDVPVFIEALSNALTGKRANVFDGRIINHHGDGIWYRIKFAVMYDDNGDAVKFVGQMVNIDHEKKEKSRLIAQAETDQLTGYLNKMSTTLKINELIKENPAESAAMFLIDIDDFKKLNDTYGHYEGDNFLRSFTEKMALSFRSSDVLGRVGGEEFLIFVPGIGNNSALIEEKANEIQKSCHSIRVEAAPDREFSCSIGIARFPFDGANYTELFERADKAMYSVKNSGKNDFAFYK